MSVSGVGDRLSSFLMNCRFCPLANCSRGTGAEKKKDFRYKPRILWAVQLSPQQILQQKFTTCPLQAHTLVDTPSAMKHDNLDLPLR